MSEGPTRVPVEDVLAVFERRADPYAPLTAPEVAEEVGCARRTAHAKLETLAERGELRTKAVGARGRVWWLAPERRGDADESPAADGPHASDDRSDHERALRELHDASRRLIRAETREEVCEVAVDAARRVLGLPLNGLWLYDPDEGVLEPAAWTERGVEQFGEPPAFPVEESLVGRVFRDGSHRVYDDVTEEAEPYDPDTRVRSELVLPLGEYGVMNASSLEVGVFDEVDVSLGRVLAANVETAIERADRLAERRARRRELERQRDELRRLNRLNALVEEIIRSLVGAATREEIERTVCEALADSAFYVDARVVERGTEPDSVVPRIGPGGEDVLAGEVPGAEPVRSALEDGTLRVVPRLATDERVPDPLREAAVEGGARSCLVAPLSYADTVFGALVVHAPEPDAFSERETVAFETLGRVVGFVINATNNRRLLLGNTVVEVELGLDPSDAWFTALSERLACTVTVSGVVPTEEGSLLEYATVEGASTDAVREALDEAPAVEDARVLADDGDRCSIECAVSAEAAGLRAIAEYGASLRTARAVDGSGSLTARFPAAASAREAVSAIEERLDGAELLAKRVVDRSERSAPTVRQRVVERLTDKQLAALRAASLAGYYDYPRGTTAEDLAASLDIAPSTLHQHLQAAQRKLLATVFDDP
jgi:predicted DNA binding protein/GAF domain-containing protein